MLRIHLVIASIFALVLLTTAAYSETYPSRYIKLVVPYPAGGAVDLTGRLLADQLQKQLNATVVVENKVGAGGTLGANYVAKSAPDGYTILLSGAATHAFAPWLYKSLPYNPLTDFAPITEVTEGYLALTVSAASDIKDVAGFIAATKEKGASMNYASNGYGTYPHLAMELLKQTAGIEIAHIPFKGGNESITALLGGQVQVTLNHLPVVQPQAEAGTVRVLATSGAARTQAFPNVPTLKEAGYDVVASAWFGLFAPAGTPREIIDRLAAAVAQAAKDPAFRDKLRTQGDEVHVEGPDSFLALQKSELEKWKHVIEKAGIVVN